MFRTEEPDIILAREMLANSPFANTKCGTVQRGCDGNEIAEHLPNVQTPRFKVDQRGVRERYSLIAKTNRKKIREEEWASGISTPELSELDQALQDLIVREDEADRGIQEATAQKRNVKDDEKDAKEIRKRAMERLEDEKKWEWRKGEEKEIKWKQHPGISKRKEWEDWWNKKTRRTEEWKYNEVDESATATTTQTNWGFPNHDDDHVLKVFGEELMNYGL